MTAIATYPWGPQVNPYLNLFQNALKKNDYHVYSGLFINDEYLREHAHRFSAIHFHWGFEDIWRRGRSSRLAQLRTIVGFWRFLRLAKKIGIRLIWSVHELQPILRPTWIDRLGYYALAQNIDLGICHSEKIRTDFVSRYRCRAESTVVIPIGNFDGVYPAPQSREQTLSALGFDPLKRTLLCCGLLLRSKGFKLALDAVRRLGTDYQLIIAGTPKDKLYADELTAHANGMSQVRILAERISDQEVANLYEAADSVLLPYESVTGSSALLTAATLRRGVVASDLPFFQELLASHSEAGVLFPSGDVNGLVAAIEDFFSVPADHRSASARAFADRFDWCNVIRPVVQRFDELGLRKHCPIEPKSSSLVSSLTE